MKIMSIRIKAAIFVRSGLNTYSGFNGNVSEICKRFRQNKVCVHFLPYVIIVKICYLYIKMYKCVKKIRGLHQNYYENYCKVPSKKVPSLSIKIFKSILKSK